MAKQQQHQQQQQWSLVTVSMLQRLPRSLSLQPQQAQTESRRPLQQRPLSRPQLWRLRRRQQMELSH
jgi:predicted RNA-binding protein with PUA-like domain